LLLNSLPIPRQQLIEPVSGVCGNASEHIGDQNLPALPEFVRRIAF
jgi:hypothetical protein